MCEKNWVCQYGEEKRRCRVCLLRRCVRCVVLFCVLHVIETRCVLCHTYSSKTHSCTTFCHSCHSFFHSLSVTILSKPLYGFCFTERLPSIPNYALHVIFFSLSMPPFSESCMSHSISLLFFSLLFSFLPNSACIHFILTFWVPTLTTQ